MLFRTQVSRKKITKFFKMLKKYFRAGNRKDVKITVCINGVVLVRNLPLIIGGMTGRGVTGLPTNRLDETCQSGRRDHRNR